jgi:DNA end-binding protein Ku
MRSIWKGAISFGLVNIPVKLFSASRARELKFKLLHKKDHSEIRYAKVCKSEEKEIPWEEVVKGYEYRPGEYVEMTDEDFEKADIKKSKTIEILDFVKEDEIDTIYYDNTYYLEPEKGAGNAYNLLREALIKSKKVAVGKFVFKTHEHLGVVKPYGKILILQQLRYEEEIVSIDDINVPKEKDISKKEVEMALKLIDQMTKGFKIENYKDTYNEEIKEIIEKKAKGMKLTSGKKGTTKSTKVHDIMSLLKESLAKEKHHERRKTA